MGCRQLSYYQQAASPLRVVGSATPSNKDIQETKKNNFFSWKKTISKKAEWNFLYEKEDHLGNVHVVVSDLKKPVDTNNNGTVDYYEADVVSATDYYAFGSPMPGRTFNSSDYRYGFNGQEKTDEISGSGNSNTAEFWQYDTRLGRRWNIDPILIPSNSSYLCFNDNPIYYVDTYGLYGSKRKAEKMRERAASSGAEVSQDVYYSSKKKEWYFVQTWDDDNNDDVVDITYKFHYHTRYFGSINNRIGDFLSDINPIKDADFYVGALIKTEIQKGPVKLVVPYGGFQASYNTESGGRTNFIGADQTYLNVKVGKADIRVMPAAGAVGGDYNPGARLLYTVWTKPIVVPAGEIPIIVGEMKAQVDVRGTLKEGLGVGGRFAAETLPIPTFQKNDSGIKLELNAGFRFNLKVPDYFSSDQ